MKPVAYEGTEPYIFVSYAHRDAERVFEVLMELQNRGYRLWYDDGIAPGSEWPEDIARHLDGAEMVIAFVTANSMQSQNCRREINFSLSREKSFLSILLEKTDMPLGMQMQLSAQQSILRYNYDSWQGFINKILACPGLAPCKAEAVVSESVPVPASGLTAAPEAEIASVPEPVLASIPAPAISSESVPASTPTPESGTSASAEPAPKIASASESVIAPDSESAPTLTSAPESARKEKTAHAEASGAPSAGDAPAAKSGKKKLLPLVAIGVVALAVLGVLVLSLGGRGGSSSLSAGGESTVEMSDKALTQEDLEELASREGVRTLELAGCDLSACDLTKPLDFASDIWNVDLSGSTGVDSLAFLSNAVSINKLIINDTDVSDLEPVASFASLSTIEAARTKVTSLDPLAGLEHLRVATFDGCAIEAISEPFSSLSMRALSLADTPVSDLSGLADLTVLEEVDLSRCAQLTSMDWLDAQNGETLKTLALSQTGLDSDDLAFVAGCAQLKNLEVDGVPLKDLDVCKDIETLQYVSAIGCGLTSIDGLAGHESLTEVYLACNKIEDASALATLAESTDRLVDLSFNNVASVEGLPGGHYRALLLYGNDEGIALTISPDLDVYDVTVPYVDGIEKSALANRGNFGEIYLVDCPKKKQLKVEEALGGVYTTFASLDELLQVYRDASFDYKIDYDWTYFLSLVDAGKTDGAA